MGAWSYVLGRLPRLVPRPARPLHSSAGPTAGSPATGSGTVHQLELPTSSTGAVGPLPEPEAED